MYVLDIENLTKAYGDRLILDIPSLKMEQGIHWIEGENGAGKSTLFRILAGMLPFQGRIWVNGKYEILKDAVSYRFLVNLGEAEPVYPSFLTPANLIQFVADASKSPAGQVDMLIEAFQINYLNIPFGECSSGMVKKVSLLLAFIGEPAVIILDEPLITIDTQAQNVLFKLIEMGLNKEVSFIMSSHQSMDHLGLPIHFRYQLKNTHLIRI